MTNKPTPTFIGVDLGHERDVTFAGALPPAHRVYVAGPMTGYAELNFPAFRTEAAIAEAKTAVEGGDAAAMTEKSQALAQVAMKLGQAIYEKEQQAAASPNADGDAPKADEDVVDAEFSEVEDDKK